MNHMLILDKRKKNIYDYESANEKIIITLFISFGSRQLNAFSKVLIIILLPLCVSGKLLQAAFKVTTITKVIACMKIDLLNQKWHFCQGYWYFWLYCCMSNIYITHRPVYAQRCSFECSVVCLSVIIEFLPCLIPFTSKWHAG